MHIKTIVIATLEEMLTRILRSEILKSCVCWCVQKNICECLKCTRIAMRLLRVLNGCLSSHFARRRRENENRQMSFSVRRGTLLRVRSSVLEGVGAAYGLGFGGHTFGSTDVRFKVYRRPQGHTQKSF